MNVLKFCLQIFQFQTNKQPNAYIYYYSNFFNKCVNKSTNIIWKSNLRRCILTNKYPLLFLWAVPFLPADSKTTKSTDLKVRMVDQKKEIKRAIQKADELFESNKYEEAVSELLPFKEIGDVEILWRLSRAQYNLSQSSITTEPQKRQLISEAYDAISAALAQDEDHWAVHKWMSVLLDAKASYDGIKARVTQLENVKQHMLRAAELNPKDATTLYMLGSWCYQIADMPWVQRKIAATIFAAPPTSSFEEALTFFSKAEEVEPRFYSQNLLMLGKTLLRLGRQSEAVQYLSLASNYPSSSEEDDQVRKEATEILKTVKLKE